MGLDYWNPDENVNFRDVGDFINLIAGEEIMQVKHLYRGGTLKHIRSLSVINNPCTILNLKKEADRDYPEVNNFHFPISNDYEKYHTSTPEVRLWLNSIFTTFENPKLKLPVFIHCLSGKDRTGIVIGIILKLIEIPQDIIIEEYMLSDGDVRKELFIEALNGVNDINTYFRRIDIEKVKINLKTWLKL